MLNHFAIFHPPQTNNNKKKKLFCRKQMSLHSSFSPSTHVYLLYIANKEKIFLIIDQAKSNTVHSHTRLLHLLHMNNDYVMCLPLSCVYKIKKNISHSSKKKSVGQLLVFIFLFFFFCSFINSSRISSVFKYIKLCILHTHNKYRYLCMVYKTFLFLCRYTYCSSIQCDAMYCVCSLCRLCLTAVLVYTLLNYLPQMNRRLFFSSSSSSLRCFMYLYNIFQYY